MASSHYFCGLAHLLETDLAQGGWFTRNSSQGAQTCTQTRQNNKKRQQKGRSSVHNSYQTRSGSAQPHMTEQLFPFIAAIWECIREAGWYGLKIEMDAKVCSTSGCHRCNWDWWWSRVTAALAVTQQPPNISTGGPTLFLALISRFYWEIKMFSVVAERAILNLWLFPVWIFSKTPRLPRQQGGSDRNLYICISQSTVCLSCSQRGWGVLHQCVFVCYSEELTDYITKIWHKHFYTVLHWCTAGLF